MGHEADDPKNLVKRAETLGNQRMSRDHPNSSFVEIGKNIESWRFEETCFLSDCNGKTIS